MLKPTEGEGNGFSRHAKKRLKLARIKTWLLCASICFSLLAASCTQYDPALYPSYDVLVPGIEVLANPFGTTPDGYYKVNAEFLQWVQELQAEIVKLRKMLK